MLGPPDKFQCPNQDYNDIGTRLIARGSQDDVSFTMQVGGCLV